MVDEANTVPQIETTPYVSPYTYTVQVTGLKVKDEGGNTNAVVQTYWKLTGSDGNGNQGIFNGATPFTSTTMPEGDTFVPFEQLTEQTVIDWILDVITQDPGYQQHIDTQIAKQIESVTNPVTEAPLPWAAIPSANT